MTTPSRVVLIGAGGHASDVLAMFEGLASATGGPLAVVGLVDDRDDVDTARFTPRGVDVVGDLDALGTLDATHSLLAVGWPSGRAALANRLQPWALPPVPGTADPRAVVHPTATLGEGTVVLHGASLSAWVVVGSHALVSHHAVVGHDTEVGDFTSVMPGAVLSGGCRVGSEVLVGTHATVIEGITVGDGARVGAGAVVVRDVPPGATVTGVPARSVD